MKKLLPLALALCCLSGCFKSTFVYNSAGGAQVLEETRTHKFFGLSGPSKILRADRMCPAGVASVETKASFGNLCLSCVTLQIYTPRTVVVTCNSGQAHNFYLDDQDRVLHHETVEGIAPLQPAATITPATSSEVL